MNESVSLVQYVFKTHIESPDGGRRLVGLHHLRQRPHLLDAGGHGLRVREALEDIHSLIYTQHEDL